MSGSRIPNEPPPSYDEVTASSSSGTHPTTPSTANASHDHSLHVPGSSTDSSIPLEHRRSMEDANRPLPEGWVRTFDPESHHQFFVDTKADPPRSVWVHPYDDEEYLRTLSSEERERIEHESLGRGHPNSRADMIAGHTDDEDEHNHATSPSSATIPAELPPRPDGAKDKGKPSFGRRLKDKVTGTTHEEREIERKRRAEEEARLYQHHLRIREAMAKAAQTGQPQIIGKDRQGRDVYVEPPPSYGGRAGFMGGPSAYGASGYGYNPYGSGMYAPSGMYMRPSGPYQRPYGRGYGGGYGLPLAVGGGLLGGMMLGDLMF